MARMRKPRADNRRGAQTARGAARKTKGTKGASVTKSYRVTKKRGGPR